MPTYVLTKPLHLAKTRHERASLNIRSFSILREYNSDCQADYQSSYHFIQLCLSSIRKWLSSKLQKIEKKILTCFASSNSGSLTESARYSTFFQKIFFHHIFEGKILNNTKKESNFLFLIGGAAEEWKAGKTWIQSVNIYQVIPATNISIDRSKTTSSSSLTFLRQPTRLFILFRCPFSPVPSVPARMPTLWGDLIIGIFAW